MRNKVASIETMFCGCCYGSLWELNGATKGHKPDCQRKDEKFAFAAMARAQAKEQHARKWAAHYLKELNFAKAKIEVLKNENNKLRKQINERTSC